MYTRIITVFIIISYVLTPFSFSEEADIEIWHEGRIKNISNRRYFPNVLKGINNASESIYLVMYIISFYPKHPDSLVSQLIDALVSAKDRGVKVKVILDYRKKRDLERTSINSNAYKYLTKNEIDVSYDSIDICTHIKTLVIDRRFVILGSSNWSEYAFNRNNEENAIIDSPSYAERVIDDISKIKLNFTISKEQGETISIPYNFVLKDNILGQMENTHDLRSLDLFLILLRESKGTFNKTFSVSYKGLAEELGLTETMDRTGWRRQINKTLRKLESRYGLIELKTEFNKPFKVKLKDSGEDYLYLPLNYWNWNWNKLLNMKEKVCLLINLSEIKSNESLSEWSLSFNNIASKYGIDDWTAKMGMSGLRNYNIIRIESSTVEEKDYSKRAPNVYYYLGLYNMNEFSKGLQILKELYGSEKTILAQECAAIIWRKYDLKCIMEIIELIEIYGSKKVKKAFKEISKKRPDNPQRTLRYAIGIIKNLP